MSLERIILYPGDFTVVSIIVRIVMAVVFGSLTGLDRTKKGRPAGFRTYSMVCLGACMTMLVGQYIVFVQGLTTDPARISAQVVSGIGFLGAGTILLNNKNQVKGLTTAAGLWASACLGLAIGAGFYLAATVGLLAIIMIETVMHKINDRILLNAPVIYIYFEMLPSESLGNMILTLKKSNIQIVSIEKAGGNECNINSYFLSLRINRHCRYNHNDVVQIISSSDGITFCEEIS